MSIPDNLLIDYFNLITDVPDEEIEEFRREMESGANPMTFKKRLAAEIITQLYDGAAADAAEDNFKRVVQNRETPDEIADFRVSGGVMSIPQIMVDASLAKSKSEAMRLISQSGVELDGVKVTEANCEIKDGAILKVGKRRFVRLVTS
jgi:tyrosyl-tRNA synthetase